MLRSTWACLLVLHSRSIGYEHWGVLQAVEAGSVFETVSCQESKVMLTFNWWHWTMNVGHQGNHEMILDVLFVAQRAAGTSFPRSSS